MNQCRIFRRRGGVYYLHDSVTGKQQCLRTTSKKDALRVLYAKQEAKLNPSINRQMARAYLQAADESYVTRTWGDVMASIIATKIGSTRKRWETASRGIAYDLGEAGGCSRLARSVQEESSEYSPNGSPRNLSAEKLALF